MKSFSELTSASQVNNGDLLAISQENSGSYASKKTTVKDVTDKANLNLAEEYDSTSTYAVDDYVIYESVLYKCISATTGTFDSTKWTSVVVTDEMGSGGGGTGGHTIIDENGNSMTARAGLQFVGGANVSDDATNNKTIVDLASAGGIDGVFIDVDNVVKDDFTIDGTAHDWIATEDCIVFGLLQANDQYTSAYFNIDGESAFVTLNATTGETAYIPVKKGQTLTYRSKSGTYTRIKAYGIQTGTTHSKFQPVIYSAEEREIGVWTDGKPLYEKTIDCGNISASTGKTIAHNISNFDKLVSYDIVAFNTTENRWNGIPRVDNDASYQRGFGVDVNNVYISQSQNAQALTNCYATIRYTKTTDTAGSGSWTPQGVPTHHYSTDEHIVGTWMGETLWEKTLTGLNIPVANDWSSVFGDNLNIKFLVNAILYDTQVSANPIVVNVSDKQVLNGGIRINNAQSTSRVITMAVLQYTKTS